MQCPKSTKRQPMVDKILHRKLKIEQLKPHYCSLHDYCPETLQMYTYPNPSQVHVVLSDDACLVKIQQGPFLKSWAITDS
jgi:hypothetical protein